MVAAYETGEEDLEELWLVDADGTDERLLVDTIDYGTAVHGTGPEWSPTGERNDGAGRRSAPGLGWTS